MARLSNEQIKSMTLNECERYSQEHPKEAWRIAKQTSETTITCSRFAANNLVKEIFPWSVSSGLEQSYLD